jgi:hypothetical protein
MLYRTGTCRLDDGVVADRIGERPLAADKAAQSDTKL